MEQAVDRILAAFPGSVASAPFRRTDDGRYLNLTTGKITKDAPGFG